jgi:hypothetical protein
MRDRSNPKVRGSVARLPAPIEFEAKLLGNSCNRIVGAVDGSMQRRSTSACLLGIDSEDAQPQRLHADVDEAMLERTVFERPSERLERICGHNEAGKNRFAAPPRDVAPVILRREATPFDGRDNARLRLDEACKRTT